LITSPGDRESAFLLIPVKFLALGIMVSLFCMGMGNFDDSQATAKKAMLLLRSALNLFIGYF
jgi:hypothetical protein